LRGGEGADVFDHLRADIARLREYGDHSPLPWLYFRHQGLWACACYRSGRWLSDHRVEIRKRWIPKQHLKLVIHTHHEIPVWKNRPRHLGGCLRHSVRCLCLQ
jgi:hypothetical protein